MKSRSAFTLVELLVVIGIIAVLLGLFLPAVQAARATARKLQCANRMKQIGLAIHHYHAQYDQFPPSKWGIETPSDSRIKHHILTFLLPFLEQQTLYEHFDFRYHWNDTGNSKNLETSHNQLPIFHCPEAPRETVCKNKEYYVGDYAVAEIVKKTYKKTLASGEITGGVGELFDHHIVSPRSAIRQFGILQPPTINLYDTATGGGETKVPWVVTATMVTDGLSHTMMFMESAGRPFLYIKGRYRSPNGEEPKKGADWADNMAPLYIESTCGAGDMQIFNCTNNNEIYSFHSGGANFLYGDGAVHFHTEEIHPETFISLFTAYAGDQVPSP